MTSIEIEYCVPCGLRDSAEQLQQRLLDEYEEELDELALVMGHGGVIIVRVDGEQVFHSGEEEGDLEDIVSAVGSAIEE